MHLRNTIPQAAALLLLVAANAPAENGWKPLCNGTDLTGWTSEPKLDHWSVRDGVIVGKNGAEMKGSMLSNALVSEYWMLGGQD
jgi:hypothetical protein